MYVSIDRFEGNFAICEREDFKIIKILKNKLPPNVHEGDVLNMGDDGCFIDVDLTWNKKKENYRIQKELFNK